MQVNAYKIYELEKVDRYSTQTQYAYRPVYPGNIKMEKKIEKNIRWSCEVVGHESRYFEAQAFSLNENIICEIKSKGADMLR